MVVLKMKPTLWSKIKMRRRGSYSFGGKERHDCSMKAILGKGLGGTEFKMSSREDLINIKL